jgi:DNA invertase Pin-like site-specific DNA recombinase
MMGAFAQYEKSMIVLKLRAARNRKKAKTGKCEGRKSIKEAAPNTLDEIKRLRRTKPGQKQMPCVRIAEKLNEGGYKTVSGKPWTGPNVQAVLDRF